MQTAAGRCGAAIAGTLDEGGIDAVLRGEWYAHLGCVLPDGRPYVVPIAYAYDGHAIFGYTSDGVKLDALRADPRVCLSIGRIVDGATWTSVMVRGTFEELENGVAADALRRLSDRLQTVAAADNAPPAASRTHVARTRPYGIAFRIRIVETTGRYSDATP